MKKQVFRAVLIAAIAVLMTLIFGFSGQTGEVSGGLSAIIAQPLTELIASFSPDMLPQAEALLYQQVDYAVRKTAHFCEYGLLGLLLCLLLRSYGCNAKLPPWILGVIYAVTDEIHQMYVPDRTGKVEDVLLDALGVFCGVMFIQIYDRFRRKC